MSAATKVRLPAKRCRCCGERQPVDGFYRHPHNRDGLQSWCKACMKKRSVQTNRAHGWYKSELTPSQRAKWAEIARQNAVEEGEP
jgi:hypothetical protein